MPKVQTWSRLGASLTAGAIAIAVNTALLEGADAIGFTTARGGLPRLLKDLAAQGAPHVGLADTGSNVIAPATTGDLFRNGFQSWSAC